MGGQRSGKVPDYHQALTVAQQIFGWTEVVHPVVPAPAAGPETVVEVQAVDVHRRALGRRAVWDGNVDAGRKFRYSADMPSQLVWQGNPSNSILTCRLSASYLHIAATMSLTLYSTAPLPNKAVHTVAQIQATVEVTLILTSATTRSSLNDLCCRSAAFRPVIELAIVAVVAIKIAPTIMTITKSMPFTSFHSPPSEQPLKHFGKYHVHLTRRPGWSRLLWSSGIAYDAGSGG